MDYKLQLKLLKEKNEPKAESLHKKIKQEKLYLDNLLKETYHNFFKKLLFSKDSPNLNFLYKGNTLYFFKPSQSYLDHIFSIEFKYDENSLTNFKFYNIFRININKTTPHYLEDIENYSFLIKVWEIFIKNQQEILTKLNSIPIKIFSKSKLPSLNKKLQKLKETHMPLYFELILKQILKILEKDILNIPLLPPEIVQFYAPQNNSQQHTPKTLKIVSKLKDIINLEIECHELGENQKPYTYQYSTNDLPQWISVHIIDGFPAIHLWDSIFEE